MYLRPITTGTFTFNSLPTLYTAKIITQPLNYSRGGGTGGAIAPPTFASLA